MTMKWISSLGRSAKQAMGRGTRTFGLREAIVVALIGVIISTLVVWAEIH